MLSRLRSEIVLGALLSTVFWAAVLGWQASHAPTEKQKNECYEAAAKTGHKADECKTFWEKTTSDPIALFNLILAFSTVGLWVATISLYRTGEKQIGVALKAANAADMNARAASAVHLPLITIKPADITQGALRAPGGIVENVSVHFVTFSNVGENKAIPSEFLYGFAVGDALPTAPRYPWAENFLPNTVFEADRKITPQKFLTNQHFVSRSQMEDITKGDHLWFFCEIHYDDIMGYSHSHAFCWRWSNTGNGLGWRPERDPAYNRKT